MKKVHFLLFGFAILFAGPCLFAVECNDGGIHFIEDPITNENPVFRPISEDEARKPRAKMPELPVSEREGNFKEVELGYEEAEGKEEAARCLNCGYCC